MPLQVNDLNLTTDILPINIYMTTNENTTLKHTVSPLNSYLTSV